MHATLTRQLKRVLDRFSCESEIIELSELRVFLQAHGAPPTLQKIADGLPDFLRRVDQTYVQFERDLNLRTRSLQISSEEFLKVNSTLREELIARENAISELKLLVSHLRQNALSSDENAPGNDLALLVEQVSTLVHQQKAQQVELQHLHSDLANQKYALDQHAIVSMTDLQGAITYANDRFCDISGYSREELIGANHRVVRSDEHPASVFHELWATITAGKVWNGEIKNRKKNGQFYWVSASIVPLLNQNGIPAQYIAIRTDITKRKEMEQQLAAQLHFTKELIQALPTALYLKDETGHYQEFNKAFESLFGIQRQGWIGKTVFDLVPGEMAEMMAAKDKELFRDGGLQSYEGEFTRHNTGEKRFGLYWKARLTRPNGSISGLIGTILDITDRKRTEKDLQEAKAAAEAANRAKSDFLANMSHEIRTPMNGIIGMTELALDTALDSTQRDYLNIVRSSADALLVILNDILDFSKIEAGKLAIETIGFNLPVTITEALKSIAARAQKKGLTLVIDLPEDFPTMVEGDPGRIRQVLSNLCDNAIKFTSRGDITIRAEASVADGDHCIVTLSISDMGIGIPKDKQAQIFQAFTQADASTTRQFGGTGLGLTICARLVQLMGGKIWVESETGVGSTFHFSVRLKRRNLLDETNKQLPLLTLWKGFSALVVDDHSTNRRSLSHWLHTWGFRVDEAQNGIEALEKCQKTVQDSQPYHLIILDVHMPLLDGFGFAAALKAQNLQGTTQLVMLSSGGSKGDSQRCRELGIGSYLTKPATPVELRETLTRILAPHGTDAPNPPIYERTFVTRHSLKEQQRQLNILVVEDNPVNQKLVTLLLGKMGHKVTLVQNGQEAVDIFPTSGWDVVLMDMQMPVMGGIEATRIIRKNEPPGQRTPIIAMTANAMASDSEECLNAGMDEHLSKPINVKLLQTLLDHFCARALVTKSWRIQN
ncbi:MAG: response regulator [Burkholderiaceae bacterium]|nr:response regulator [Burkholderiaceae bacterium]